MAHLNSVFEALPVHDGPSVIANFDGLIEIYPACERVGCDHRSSFGKGGVWDFLDSKFPAFLVEQYVSAVAKMKITSSH